MPPKQKQVKKGPSYKTATAPKDMVPSNGKEPRQGKPIKVPDSFPDLKNNQEQSQLPVLFEQWPSEEAVKGFDFGIASQVKFQDKQHEAINEYLKRQINDGDKVVVWKRLHEIQFLKENYRAEEGSSSDEEEVGIKSQANFEQSSSRNNILGEKNEQENSEPKMVVIETFMRDETEEQMQKRKKEEAERAEKAAKDKKKGKKQEPKEQGQVQVSDVKMVNIVVKKYMAPTGIWIGSQLQIIKIRNLLDIYTEESVWKKIYPQQNGVPQITKSGKYWVKLYYMGKAIKIQVDDRVPLGHKMKQLFPTSEKQNQKWTLILTKALMKYYMLINSREAIVGSGLIMYALTGMISQNLPLKKFDDWKKVQNLMSDSHYQKKDIILNCFSYNSKGKSPSNYIRSVSGIKDYIGLGNSTFKHKKERRSSAFEYSLLEKIQEKDHIQDRFEERYIENRVIAGCSYCIGDYFQNDWFNMIFSKERSMKEQHLRQQYSEMSKVPLANKSRDEKLEHRRKKKEIKEKLLIEEKKRLELISKPPVSYYFLKLLADVVIHCEYSDKEILLAKKCVLNNLQQPPNYDIPNFSTQKDELKSVSASVIKLKEESEVNPSLDDFSSIENTQQIYKRPDEGVWIKNEDLFSTFDEIQIFYNPNIFQYKSIENVESKQPGLFSYDENREILVIEKKGNPHDNEAKEANQGENEVISFLFGFMFQLSKLDTLSDPYCMLQKFDFDSYRTTSNFTTLNKVLSSTYSNLKNQNSVFKLYTMSKGRYSYWISADSQYKLLSIADYLIEYEAYTSKAISIEYPALEANSYQALSRIKIRHEGEDNNTLIIKLKNCPREIEKNLNFRLVQIPETGIYAHEQIEGIIKNNNEAAYLVFEYSRFELKPGTVYELLIEAYPSNNMADGTLDLIILTKQSNAIIEQIEQIEPYKVIEKYLPNKYANLFRQRLFCSKNINVSLIFKVVEGEEGQPIATDKKAAKKGGKEEPTFQIVQRPLEAKRLIHVKIIKNDKIVYYGKGYNEVIISNIELESTKQKNQYFVEASFDLRQWPEASAQNEENNKIYWTIEVEGEDAVAFVKDTLKEDQQKETRKSWEDKQPGRAEKAKKARQRFLLQEKVKRGQQLTEQQQQIVNAPRMTKKQLLEEEKKNEEKKGGKGAKKDDKKGGKDKKQQVVEEKKQERVLPKSENNHMIEVKEFLKNLEECVVKRVFLHENEEGRIRTAQEQNSIKEGALMSKENRISQIVRNIETRQTMKVKEKDKKDKLTILLEETRSNFITEWKNYIQWRTEDQEKDKARQEKEKQIIDIINQQKPTISENDLLKTIKEYREIEGHNPKLADVGEMIRKNIKIGGLSEKMSNMVAGWEVDELKAAMEEIKNEKIEGLDGELMGKVAEILEEAEKNPSLVAEKQAELKKNKKGGKK